MEAIPRGTPLQAVALLLLLSILYDRLIAPHTTTRLHPSMETWWWAVYVASAPLLFGGPSVYPMLGLFCTRFVVEILTITCTHWAVALGSSSRTQQPILADNERETQRMGIPLLPD